MIMEETKSLFLSRTFWAGAASVILGVLPMLGLDPEALTASGDLGEKLYGAAVLVAGVGAIIGRLRATRQVSVKSPTAPEVTIQ